MSYLQLPKRVFNSPLIEYTNFEDEKGHINIIRLVKPYANGITYAVYDATTCVFASNGLFKNYQDAKEKYDILVKNCKSEGYKVKNFGKTCNFTEDK